MKFVWNDLAEIGVYELSLIDNDNVIEKIYFNDYSAPNMIEDDIRDRNFRRYSFEIRYCNNGCSFYKGFDEDVNFNNHYHGNGKVKFGFNGNCQHTVNDIKRYCEEYLASLYIIDYEAKKKEMLETLEEMKRKSDELIFMSYTGEYLDRNEKSGL